MNTAGYPEVPGYTHDVPHPTTMQAKNLPDYCNQKVISRNKLPAHCPLRCLSTEEEALSCKFEEGVQTGDNLILLTPPGTRWAFHFAGTPQGCPAIKAGKGFDQTGWDTITVPSNWETQGYGEALCK
jgi:beta-galactosidase